MILSTAGVRTMEIRLFSALVLHAMPNLCCHSQLKERKKRESFSLGVFDMCG